MKKKILIIGLIVFLFGLTASGILFSYYKGDRKNYLNTTINNFSKNHPQLSISLKKVTKILDVLYIFHQFIPSKIPTYSLLIDSNDLEKLNTNLPQEGKKLTSEYKKFVPAQFIFNNKTYQVKVRYRGDNPNHWQFDKKSWRIKFENKFENQKAINLILPEDRYFFIEPWISYMGQKLGLVTPEFTLVNLKVNNKLHGVYLKSEQWGKTFLENYNLSPDADLYGEAEFDKQVSNLYADVYNFRKYTFNSSKPKNDVSNLKTLLDLLNNFSDQEFYKKIPDIIDMSNFLHWQAQSTLAFSHSQKISHNLIAYFNPEINKFQFIPWDVAMADEEPVYPDINYNPLMTRILKNSDYMFQRNQILWEYIKDQKNLEGDLNYFDNLYQNTRGAFYRDPLKIFPNLDFDLTVKKHRKRIITAQNKIKELLNDARSQIKIQSKPDFEPTALVYFEIESNGFASIKLSQIKLVLNQTAELSLIIDSDNNQQLDFNDKKLGSFQADNNQYLINLENILIHTNRDIQKQSQPFLLKPTKQGFFIISSKKEKPSNINIRLQNAITDKVINN